MRKALGATLVGFLFLSLAPVSALAGKRKVPARVVEARSVALGFDLGDRFLSESAAVADPDVQPGERRALQAIRDEIRRWGKYVVTVRPGDADLLIAVRLGVRENVGAGTRGDEYVPGPGGMRRGSSYGPDLSSSDDMLVVYDCVEGRVGKRLWRVRKAGGLAGATPALFAEFRTDVERTPEPAKSEPAKK
jgi:hypothetical protein